MEMYCVKCRCKREDPEVIGVTMKNGKPAVKGKCPVCHTGMYKIGNMRTPTVEFITKQQQMQDKQMLTNVLESKL